jgi:hypothetical protein
MGTMPGGDSGLGPRAMMRPEKNYYNVNIK